MRSFFRKDIYQEIIVNALFIFAIEIISRVVLNYEIIDYATLRILVSSFFISGCLSFILSFISKKKIKNILYGIAILIITLYAFIQTGLNSFIGSFISLGISSQAGAVTQYIGVFLSSVPIYYYFIWIPMIIYIFYFHLNMSKNKIRRISIREKMITLLFCALFAIIYVMTITLDFMQNPIQIVSNRDLFHNPSNSSICINQFGLTSYGILDIKQLLLPSRENHHQEEVVVNEKKEVQRVIDDEDWLNIIEKEQDQEILQLHQYFIHKKISDYNEYSGIFEGKNVIFVMMETVGDAFLKEEYFPNFAKILKNSWYFENNYSPRNTCATADNEFSGITSLYAVNSACTANTYLDNTYFQSVFNLFRQKGYTASSYHNYNNQFYYRNIYHKNLGSERYYNADDLGIDLTTHKEPNWPSDVELMEKSYEIFSQNTPFMAWITTVTGHYPYDVSSEYGDKYLELFEDTNYSIEIKRYLSKIKVTDDSLGKLLELLTENKQLENTVIVLYGDHYPYALSDKMVQELFDYDITEFYERDRVPFAIYNPSIERKTFSQKTSYMNILPTIANLFNLDFDPRFYFGEDLFSQDYSNRIIFPNDSWEDSIARYDSNLGKITYLGKEKYSLEEIRKINNEINLKRKMSTLAIKKNYFEILDKEKEEQKSEEKEASAETEE